MKRADYFTWILWRNNEQVWYFEKKGLIKGVQQALQLYQPSLWSKNESIENRSGGHPGMENVYLGKTENIDGKAFTHASL